MIKPGPKALRCAIYTRVSTEHGLEQDFNSLDAQREAGRAYVKSQTHEGWRLVKESFDDGGFSGGSLERPALQRLLAAIRSRFIDVVVVYKVDRLTRSLADFAKLVRVLRGSIFDVAVDIRRGSPTYGRWCGSVLTAEGAEQIFIPRGLSTGTEVAAIVGFQNSRLWRVGGFW